MRKLSEFPKSAARASYIALGLSAIGTWFILYPLGRRNASSDGYGILLLLRGIGTAINIYGRRFTP